jgi:hypothetical protein
MIPCIGTIVAVYVAFRMIEVGTAKGGNGYLKLLAWVVLAVVALNWLAMMAAGVT